MRIVHRVGEPGQPGFEYERVTGDWYEKKSSAKRGTSPSFYGWTEKEEGNAALIARAVNTIDDLTRQRDALQSCYNSMEKEIIELRGRHHELRELLQDLHAFTQFALDHQIPAGQICATIGHDIGGTLDGERCFSPRVHGMSKQQAIAAAERGNQVETTRCSLCREPIGSEPSAKWEEDAMFGERQKLVHRRCAGAERGQK